MRKLSTSIVAAAACAALLAAVAPAARGDVSYYTPPKFKHKVLPVYPAAARAAHETGTVLIKVLVATDGTPKQFILFKSSGHKDLDAAVLAAAKASTYSPAMRGTTPTLGFYDVTYKFNLTGIAEDEGNQADLAKKLDANPKDVQTRLALGTAYLNQKNFGQAEQVFQTGTQLIPDNAKLWAYQGLAYYQDAQTSNDPTKYKPAVDAYDRALKLDPHVETSNVAAAAYFNYGFHLQQSGDNADAILNAQKAIALNPKYGQYYILLGEAQTAQGDFANAIATLKKAQSLDDKKNTVVTVRILADLGNAELSQGDRANGLADINRAEQIKGDDPIPYMYLFSYYIKSKNSAAALTPLNQLAQLQKDDPHWQVEIGTIYLQQNNVAAAKAAFQKAIAIKPDNVEAQFGMAALGATTGDTASIGPVIQKIAATSTPQQASVYEGIIAIDLLNASASSKTSYAADAQKYADMATKADPTNGQAWYALGVADAQVNKSDKATASAALKKAYDIFKSQNNQDMMSTVNGVYKQINGTTIGGSAGEGGGGGGG